MGQNAPTQKDPGLVTQGAQPDKDCTLAQFKEDVKNAARLAKQYPDSAGCTLAITFNSPTPQPNLTDSATLPHWSKFVTVMVAKVDQNGRALQKKSVNCLQFYKLYTSMRFCVPPEKGDALRMSNEAAQKIMELSDEDHACVICMERQAQICLQTCNHEFCEPCIRQWNQKSSTCPVCRRESPYSEDDWVITAKDESKEWVGDHFVKFFSGL